MRTTIYKVFILSDVLLGTTSILSLMAISVERLFAVKFPAIHFNLSWKPVASAIALTWLFGIFFAAIRFGQTEEEWTYTIFSLSFLLPTAVIIGSYFMLYIAAKESMAMAQTSRRPDKEVQVARTIGIIIGLYLFCWMPFFVIAIIYHTCKDWCGYIPSELAYFTKCMHYSNSMMNFFVYGLRSPDFRNAFKALLFRRPLVRSRGESGFSNGDPRRRATSDQSRLCGMNDSQLLTQVTPLSPRRDGIPTALPMKGKGVIVTSGL